MAVITAKPNAIVAPGLLTEGVVRESLGRYTINSYTNPYNTRNPKYFVPTFKPAPGYNEWAALTAAEQEAWEEYNEFPQLTYTVHGAPFRSTTIGCFGSYWQILKIRDATSTAPAPPLTQPSFGPRVPFFEWLEWSSGTLAAKAKVAVPEGAEYLFLANVPQRKNFTMSRAGQRILGFHTFTDGLEIDELWTGIDALVQSEFGPPLEIDKIWIQLKPADRGFLIAGQDCCTPDPTGSGPVIPTSFNFEVTNDYTSDCTLLEIDVYDATSVNIGFNYNATPPAGGTDTGTIYLDEGYDTTDVHSIYWTADFDDGMMGEGSDEEPSLAPYQFAIDSMM